MTPYRILVSSYTDEISTLLFDDASGRLEIVSTLKVGHHPSWITPHPNDPSVVFTGLEQPEGIAVALKFDQEGRGEEIGRTGSGGQDPCSLVATKDELLIANVSLSPKNSCRFSFALFLLGHTYFLFIKLLT